jgi:hypothetical protein
MPRARVSSLARALRYRNQDVVDRFADRFELPDRESRAIFDDTKRWLWLCSLPARPKLFISPALLIIDEMWHTFVLFTAGYAAFCQSSFGRFIHHVPTTRRERLRTERLVERNPERFARRRRTEAEKQYRFIADKLGDETLVRWYAEYPLRYDAAFFQRFGVEGQDLVPEAAERLGTLLDEARVIRARRSRGSASS